MSAMSLRPRVAASSYAAEEKQQTVDVGASARQRRARDDQQGDADDEKYSRRLRRRIYASVDENEDDAGGAQPQAQDADEESPARASNVCRLSLEFLYDRLQDGRPCAACGYPLLAHAPADDRAALSQALAAPATQSSITPLAVRQPRPPGEVVLSIFQAIGSKLPKWETPSARNPSCYTFFKEVEARLKIYEDVLPQTEWYRIMDFLVAGHPAKDSILEAVVEPRMPWNLLKKTLTARYERANAREFVRQKLLDEHQRGPGEIELFAFIERFKAILVELGQGDLRRPDPQLCSTFLRGLHESTREVYESEKLRLRSFRGRAEQPEEECLEDIMQFCLDMVMANEQRQRALLPKGRSGQPASTQPAAETGYRPTYDRSLGITLKVPPFLRAQDPCRLHPHGTHTNAACWTQHRQPSREGVGTARLASTGLQATRMDQTAAPNANNNRSAVNQCFSCGASGHISANCPTSRPAAASSVAVSSTSEAARFQARAQEALRNKSGSLAGVNPKMRKAMMRMLNEAMMDAMQVEGNATAEAVDVAREVDAAEEARSL
jgi:Zinc knuckle